MPSQGITMAHARDGQYCVRIAGADTWTMSSLCELQSFFGESSCRIHVLAVRNHGVDRRLSGRPRKP